MNKKFQYKNDTRQTNQSSLNEKSDEINFPLYLGIIHNEIGTKFISISRKFKFNKK